ncbi:MAG TPA: thiamine phosphate synthase [Vicinamibacteria bacterium]|nr:thiamine phosphate synthase [Vicinamibacteria bacterium]
MAALPAAPFAYPIVDAGRLRGRDPAFVVDSLARAGARLIQLRVKGLSDRRWLAMAGAALAAAHASGAHLVVNDRADIARIAGADGLHVGQDDLTGTDARTVVGPGVLLGVSTHNLEQLGAAATEAVDYLAIGPVFPTRTKDNPDPVVGLEMVRRARAATPRPLVAIGGITRANARSVVEAGADGVAVISDLLDAPDLARAFTELAAAIRG